MNPSRHEEQRLRKMAQLAGRGRILDIGCMNWPNRHFVGQVIGLDLKAHKMAPPYSHMVRGDAENLPFAEGAFDAVVAGELIEHLFNPLLFLSDCNRMLKIDGRLVLSTPNPHYPAETFKNILCRSPEVSTNTHIAVFPFQLMVKLASLSGFKLQTFSGDYIRIPKLGLKFGFSLFPSLCYHHIYAFVKVRDVTADLVKKTLEHIREQERTRSASLHSYREDPWANGDSQRMTHTANGRRR